MALAAFTKLSSGPNEVYYTQLDATDTDSQELGIDSSKEVTIFIQTSTGDALTDIEVSALPPGHDDVIWFIDTADAGTADGADAVKAALGPIAGIRFKSDANSSDTVEVHVIVTEKN